VSSVGKEATVAGKAVTKVKRGTKKGEAKLADAMAKEQEDRSQEDFAGLDEMGREESVQASDKTMSG
jgi:hypothetical protein